MKSLASYGNMWALKCLVVILMFTCFLLGSTYYNIGTAYVLNFSTANKDSMVSPVKVDKVGNKENVKGYWKEMMEHTTGYSEKFHGIRLRTNVGNEKTNFDIRENDITDKYKGKLKNKQNENSGIFMKLFPDSRSEGKDKVMTSTTTSGRYDKATTYFSSTISTINLNVGIKQTDTIHVHKANSNERFNGKDVTSRTTNYQAVADTGQHDVIRHTHTLDKTFGSSLATNKDNSGKIGHPVSPSKFKSLSGHRRTNLAHRRIIDIPVGPDNAYAIENLETLRINKSQNSTFVLLVTYARSGSTWLGEITNQAKQTFYVYEPLQRFVVQGYYKENLVCYNNNTCRKPRMFSETHNFAITTLHRLFTCQFTKLHPKAVYNLRRNLKSHQYAETFKRCLDISRSAMKCLQELESICLTTTHRILKTIRISMELVTKMMDLWPNLKIVHLIRDPRGITNSRLASRTFAMARNLVPHSHDMCNRIFEDVEVDTKMNNQYVNRLKLVFYESLAEMPLEGANFIYKFLDMKLTKDAKKWVYTSTHAQKKSGYFGTMRSDSTESANRWRTRLTLFKIKIIDNICHDVYNVLGIMTFETTKDLYNFSIPSRRSVKNSNWFA